MEANSSPSSIELEHYNPPGNEGTGTTELSFARSHDGSQPLGTASEDVWSKANFQKWWANNIPLSLPHSSDEDTARNHDPRDYLALERNFLAQIRTANALALFGVALLQLFRLQRLESQTGLALGATCAGGGMIIVVAGAYRYFLLQSKMSRGRTVAGSLGAWAALTVILGVIGAAFIVVLVED